MKLLLSITVLVIITAPAYGAAISISATQTGGFYAGGAAPDNLPSHQNYFVGYGTSPGGARTPERRSFFWFDLSAVSGTVLSAEIHLTLPFGGLIFGKGPGDPLLGPVPSDPTETFQLGATPFAGSAVTAPGLSGPAADAIFDSFDSIAMAGPYVFGAGPPAPPVIVIPLSGFGLSFLTTHVGSEIVLTGWMPSWSFDPRPAPPGSPTAFFEASELIFGLTDIPGAVPAPVLDVVFIPAPASVPEPASILMFALGVASLGFRALRRTTAR